MLLPCVPEQGEEGGPWPQDLQPPPLLGQHEDVQEEKSGVDERPATEPLFKVLDTPLSEGDEPTMLPTQRDLGHSVQMEGYLGRKHDLEGPNKKASNRCVEEGPWEGGCWAAPRVTQASDLDSGLGDMGVWGVALGIWSPLWATWHNRKGLSQFWS
jgi:hypothetical protein